MSGSRVFKFKVATMEDVSFRVMRLLEVNPYLSQRDIAAHVGISLGSLNYCLRALIDKGFIKLENFQNSKHKFKYAYILTPTGIAQKIVLSGTFLKRKLQEYEALEAEIKGLEAELSAFKGMGFEASESTN